MIAKKPKDNKRSPEWPKVRKDFLKGKVPTSENVAIGIWNELVADITKLGGILHCVRLEQSENNIIEYYGE